MDKAGYHSKTENYKEDENYTTKRVYVDIKPRDYQPKNDKQTTLIKHIKREVFGLIWGDKMFNIHDPLIASWVKQHEDYHYSYQLISNIYGVDPKTVRKYVNLYKKTRWECSIII